MRQVAGWALLLVAPAVVLTAYEYISRTTRNFTLASDYGAIAVALAIGLSGLLLLVRTPGRRAVAIALYVPITAIVMRLTLTVGCAVFADCP